MSSPLLRSATHGGAHRPRPVDAVMRLAGDALAITTAIGVASIGRQFLDALGHARDIFDYLPWFVPLLLPAWLLLIALGGGYTLNRLGSGTDEYSRILRSGFAIAGILAFSTFIIGFPLSRGFYLLIFAFGIPLLLVNRAVVRAFIRRARRQGRLLSPCLIAGDESHVDEISAILRRERWLGYKVIGALVPGARVGAHTGGGVPVLGAPEQALSLIDESGATVVIFGEGSLQAGTEFNRLARQFEGSDADLIVVPALTDISARRMIVRPVAGLPLVHIEKPRAEKAGDWSKRLFDVVGSSALIVMLSPVLAAVALAVKLGDGGPVMFHQTRVGLKGTHFECLKFRSMRVDAEERLAELRAHNESDGVLFKMQNDPRITRVGRVIRRFSLDELPQLFNVWRGDMSLVGPRPALPSETALYEPDVLRRLDVRPGMTGLWQVSGRSDLSWEDTVRLDLYYVDNWSMSQDLAILLRTFRAVFGSSGAY